MVIYQSLKKTKFIIRWWEFLCRATFQDLPMTQLHFSIVHRELGNSMGIISRKFQYLAAILQLEKTISFSDNWSAGNSTTDILSTLFQCLNINSISSNQVPCKGPISTFKTRMTIYIFNLISISRQEQELFFHDITFSFFQYPDVYLFWPLFTHSICTCPLFSAWLQQGID